MFDEFLCSHCACWCMHTDEERTCIVESTPTPTYTGKMAFPIKLHYITWLRPSVPLFWVNVPDVTFPNLFDPRLTRTAAMLDTVTALLLPPHRVPQSFVIVFDLAIINFTADECNVIQALNRVMHDMILKSRSRRRSPTASMVSIVNPNYIIDVFCSH